MNGIDKTDLKFRVRAYKPVVTKTQVFEDYATVVVSDASKGISDIVFNWYMSGGDLESGYDIEGDLEEMEPADAQDVIDGAMDEAFSHLYSSGVFCETPRGYAFAPRKVSSNAAKSKISENNRSNFIPAEFFCQVEMAIADGLITPASANELWCGGRRCFRCGTMVLRELEVPGYPYYCPNCDENMYSFETY